MSTQTHKRTCMQMQSECMLFLCSQRLYSSFTDTCSVSIQVCSRSICARICTHTHTQMKTHTHIHTQTHATACTDMRFLGSHSQWLSHFVLGHSLHATSFLNTMSHSNPCLDTTTGQQRSHSRSELTECPPCLQAAARNDR
jgi:hypothetical protein